MRVSRFLLLLLLLHQQLFQHNQSNLHRSKLVVVSLVLELEIKKLNQKQLQQLQLH